MTDTYTTTVTENGITFPQTVGGTFDKFSAINLRERYAAITANDPDPDPVLWIRADDYRADYLTFGYDHNGTLVATIEQTVATTTGHYDDWRYEAVVHSSHKITPPNGAATFEAAANLVNAYFRAAA